jgi:tetratricopeptide (TPR) repeat protein
LKKTAYITIFLSFIITLSLSGELTGRAKNSDRKSAGYYNRMGLRSLEKGEYGKAEEYFLLAIENNPAVKFYYNNLAAVYMKRGDYNSAYASLNRCIAIDGSYAKALANMTVTTFRLNRYLESYTYYKKALKADPVYTKKRFEKNRVVRYLRLLPDSKQENSGFSDVVKFIENSE